MPNDKNFRPSPKLDQTKGMPSSQPPKPKTAMPASNPPPTPPQKPKK